MPSSPRLFLVRAGRDGEDEQYALDHELAVIGFHDVSDLSSANDRDSIFGLVQKSYPDSKLQAQRNYAAQLNKFAIKMKTNDLVVLPRKHISQIAIGRVIGPYRNLSIHSKRRHTRAIHWVRTDVPRTHFHRDLLYSFGAFMTVCEISRNDAARRVQAVLEGQEDPGPTGEPIGPNGGSSGGDREPEVDLVEVAHGQIELHIQARFKGHSLTRLVNALLQADGWVTDVSPPGADGGVDILAGSGSLGLDSPRLCVQVKSQTSPADVTVFRTLQGTMQTFNAQQGLLVCWGGFNAAVRREARSAHFTIRLWDGGDVVKALYRHYGSLPAEIQAEIPLRRVWILVPEELQN